MIRKRIKRARPAFHLYRVAAGGSRDADPHDSKPTSLFLEVGSAPRSDDG